jgi:hypothetical protein
MGDPGQREQLKQEVHIKDIALHLYDALNQAWPQGDARIEEETYGQWVLASRDELTSKTD